APFGPSQCGRTDASARTYRWDRPPARARSRTGAPMRPGVPAVPRPIRNAAASLAQALANDGIRRLGATWTLGIAADGALVVVTLVTVFNRGGVVAAALLGAVRMVPAVIAGTGAGTLLERFRGDRILVAL